MLFSTPDLCLFFGAKIFPLNAPLRFHDKVEFIQAIILNDDGPVRVVTAEGGRNFKDALEMIPLISNAGFPFHI